MPDIRITLYLTHYFQDHRMVSRIFVSKKMQTIHDIKSRISDIFNIQSFNLVCQNHFLPDGEDVRVLEPDDIIIAVPQISPQPECEIPSIEKVKKKNKTKVKETRTKRKRSEDEEIEIDVPESHIIHKKRKKKNREKKENIEAVKTTNKSKSCARSTSQRDTFGIDKELHSQIKGRDPLSGTNNVHTFLENGNKTESGFESKINYFKTLETASAPRDGKSISIGPLKNVDAIKQKFVHVLQGVVIPPSNNKLNDDVPNAATRSNLYTSTPRISTSPIRYYKKKEKSSLPTFTLKHKFNIVKNIVNNLKTANDANEETSNSVNNYLKTDNDATEETSQEYDVPKNITICTSEIPKPMEYEKDNEIKVEQVYTTKCIIDSAVAVVKPPLLTDIADKVKDCTIESGPINNEGNIKSEAVTVTTNSNSMPTIDKKTQAISGIDLSNNYSNRNSDSIILISADNTTSSIANQSDVNPVLANNDSNGITESAVLIANNNNTFPNAKENDENPNNNIDISEGPYKINRDNKTIDDSSCMSFESASTFVTQRKRKRVRTKRRRTKISSPKIPCPPSPYRPPNSEAKPFLHIKFDLSHDSVNNESVVSTANDTSQKEEANKDQLFSVSAPLELSESIPDDIILKCPLMKNLTPREDDVIIFKILKMGEAYNPELSSYITGRVISYEISKQEIYLLIIDGNDQFIQPLGKFSIPEDESENGNGNRVQLLNWFDLIEPRLLYP